MTCVCGRIGRVHVPKVRGARSNDDDIAEPREAAAEHGNDIVVAKRNEATVGVGDVPSRLHEARIAEPIFALIVSVAGAYIHDLGWLQRYKSPRRISSRKHAGRCHQSWIATTSTTSSCCQSLGQKLPPSFRKHHHNTNPKEICTAISIPSVGLTAPHVVIMPFHALATCKTCWASLKAYKRTPDVFGLGLCTKGCGRCTSRLHALGVGKQQIREYEVTLLEACVWLYTASVKAAKDDTYIGWEVDVEHPINDYLIDILTNKIKLVADGLVVVGAANLHSEVL